VVKLMATKMLRLILDIGLSPSKTGATLSIYTLYYAVRTKHIPLIPGPNSTLSHVLS